MITFKELIKRYNLSDIPLTHQHNLEDLLTKINIIRSLYDKPMIVTSGYRTQQDHINIYYSKGITDLNKIPMRSKHLSGQAVDIYDPTGELMRWCKANVPVLEQARLWLEDETDGWVHFQTVPPKSMKRFFLP